MSSINVWYGIGHVGRDPEMRFTPSGKAVTNFSVAISEKYADQETTEWFNIVSWGKLAETCNQFVHKGMQVFVSGTLHLKTWEGQDGEKHSQLEVTANKVQFLGNKNQTEAEEITQKLEPDDVPF